MRRMSDFSPCCHMVSTFKPFSFSFSFFLSLSLSLATTCQTCFLSYDSATIGSTWSLHHLVGIFPANCFKIARSSVTTPPFPNHEESVLKPRQAATPGVQSAPVVEISDLDLDLKETPDLPTSQGWIVFWELLGFFVETRRTSIRTLVHFAKGC